MAEIRPRWNGVRSGVGQQVFTTSQLAALIGCAPRTVSNRIDAGVIRGYQLPGSRDRRVTRAEVVRVLKSLGLTAQLYAIGEDVTGEDVPCLD